MNRKIIAILSIVIAVMSTVSLAGIVDAKLGSVGTVYTIDNAMAANHVLYYFRASDGSLSRVVLSQHGAREQERDFTAKEQWL